MRLSVASWLELSSPKLLDQSKNNCNDLSYLCPVIVQESTYSGVSNRRACPFIYFQKFVIRFHRFSCSKIFFPPYPFIYLLHKTAEICYPTRLLEPPLLLET